MGSYKDQDKARARTRRYRAAHRQHFQDYQREYNRTHREAIREKQRAYDQAHRAKIAVSARASRLKLARDRANGVAPPRVYTDKEKVQTAIWREKNKERVRATRRAYNLRNREHIRALTRLHRQNNKERIHARERAYRLTHKDLLQGVNARRNAYKRGAGALALSARQWVEIKAAYDHRCVYCGKKMQRLTQDHITPLSKGGSHTATNVVPACFSCNSSKYTGPPPRPVQPLLLTLAAPMPYKPRKKKTKPD